MTTALRATSPIALVREHRALDAALAPQLTTRTQRVDEALIDAAHDIGGSAGDLRDVVLDHLDSRTGRLGKTVAAALYGATLTTGSDTLRRVLAEVEDADYALSENVDRSHEDLPCLRGDDDHCPVCRQISTDQLADALRDLRALLGDAVCDDLTSAA